jgi:hypothetical protein
VPWEARADGAFEALQPAWENFTGQTWDAHAGHGWFDAIHPEDRDAVRTAWARLLRGAALRMRGAHLARAHARVPQLHHPRTPIRNEDGSLREWVGACMEVHAPREPETRRDNLAATGAADGGAHHPASAPCATCRVACAASCHPGDRWAAWRERRRIVGAVLRHRFESRRQLDQRGSLKAVPKKLTPSGMPNTRLAGT